MINAHRKNVLITELLPLFSGVFGCHKLLPPLVAVAGCGWLSVSGFFVALASTLSQVLELSVWGCGSGWLAAAGLPFSRSFKPGTSSSGKFKTRALNTRHLLGWLLKWVFLYYLAAGWLVFAGLLGRFLFLLSLGLALLFLLFSALGGNC